LDCRNIALIPPFQFDRFACIFSGCCLDFKKRRNTPEKEAELLKEPVQQEWISYPEASRYSGLSHTTLWRYVSSGELRAARIGRSVRIHLPSLRSFMDGRVRGENSA
jgi:excisionase family DNA binding protein